MLLLSDTTTLTVPIWSLTVQLFECPPLPSFSDAPKWPENKSESFSPPSVGEFLLIFAFFLAQALLLFAIFLIIVTIWKLINFRYYLVANKLRNGLEKTQNCEP